MRKRTFVILFSTAIAIFSLVVLEQVLAVSQLENNNGLTVAEGESGIITANELSVTDTDGVITVFTYTVLTAPVNGDLRNNTTALAANDIFTQGLIDAGQLNYLHDGGETTADSFDFEVTDGVSTFVTSTFQITITPVNDAPIGLDDTAEVDEGGTITQVNGTSASVLNNDTDVDSAILTATLTAPPANAGSFNLNEDGTFSYTHNGGETTSDSFTYNVCDAEPLCDSATVSITINPVNDPPTAVDSSANVDEAASVSGDVSTDITDPDSTNLTTTVISNPVYASSFNMNSAGAYSYTHDGSENFTDEFTYEVCDNHPTNEKCDTAVVSITINPINDPPVANDDSASVAEGEVLAGVDNAPNFDQSVLHDDTDAENGTLLATITVSPTHAASFTFNSDGTFSYLHDGTPSPLADSFTYRICDDGTPTECDTAVVNIVITPINDPPLAVADTFTVAEGATLNDTVNPTPGLCAGNSNDCDEEGDPFVVITTTVNPPNYASSFNLQADGSFTYVHDGSETTSDSFTYRVCKEASSPISDCSQTDVTINITPVNDAPTPGDDTMTVPRSTTSTTLDGGVTSLLADDTDPENDALTVTTTPVSGPAHGTLTLNADGTFSYAHDDSDAPTDSFTYQVCDNGTPQECATAVVSITIGPRPITTIFLPLMLNDYPPVEPNNNACESYQIGLNATLSFTADDPEDWYKFTLNQTATLHITLSNDTPQGGLATQLIVYKGSCGNLTFVGNNGNFDQVKELTLTNMTPDTYYVRVFSNPVPNEGYTLRVDTQ